MKNLTLLLCLILFTTLIYSQEKIEWVDVDEIYKKTAEYETEGNFEEALKEISKIPKNDSAYIPSLSAKSYYLISLENYDEAIKMTDEAINAEYYPFKYYYLLDNALAVLRKKEYEKAIKLYDEIIAKYPRDYLLYYNKGVAYQELEKFEDASKMFQKSITLNPFYANNHLKLGVLCYQEHLISQAMMCLNMYLLINPDGKESFNILNSFNTLVKSKNDSEKHSGVKISADDETFEEIDLIINNYVALSKKYKTGNKINLAMVKQNHALFTQLEKYNGNGGFWDKYYVPFYKYIMQKNLFDPFVYTISYSVENAKLKKIVESNLSSIKSFIPIYQGKWTEIISENEEIVDGEKQKVNYYYKKGRMEGFGQIKNELPYGKWHIYNKYGSLSAVGSFDESGNRDGKWELFDKNGTLVEKAEYKNGELDNAYYIYYDNGNLNVFANYKDGKLNGAYEKYNENGALFETANYKDDEIDGELVGYYSLGKDFVKYRIPYTNGKINGTVHEYYVDGKLRTEVNFIDDKKEGKGKEYFNNGKVEFEKEYVNNLLEGDFVEYYYNGNIYQKGKYAQGELVGDWKLYYIDNTQSQELTYINGKADGISKTYDKDGKLHYEYTYRKGEIIAYKFYDKNQEVIKEAKKQKGEFYYEAHSPTGNITAEGLYDISGGKKGEWKFYTDNNVLESKEFNKDEMLQNDLISYHPNGEIKTITPYVDDTVHGYYASYYSNKQIEEQGWYKKGELSGLWETYYADGTIESRQYYNNGKLYGVNENFSVDGKLSYTLHYFDGKLMKEDYYLPDGTIYETIVKRRDTASYVATFNHPNGKVKNKYDVLYGKRHGKYSSYFFDGKLFLTANYFDGERHGDWIWYFNNGKVNTTGSYIHGKKDGVWKNYHENGKLESEDTYIEGSSEGVWKTYNEEGVLIKTQEFKNNLQHGELSFYSEEGKLQLTRYYQFGRLIGYSYMDKNSKMLPMIPIENETAKIVAYFDNGNISREMEIVKGEFKNAYKEYYYNGQLFEDRNNVDDEYEGEAKVYYPDGKLKEVKTYKLGNLHGELIKYYHNGNIKEQTTYLNNTKNGESKKYDEKGKLIEESIYFDGAVISEKK